MAIVATLTALLKLDTKGFSGGLNGAINSVKRFNRQLTFASRDIQTAGAGLTALTAPLAIFSAKAIKSAADAEEQASKFQTVFAGIGDSANKMVQEISTSFDLASSTTKKVLGDTGDLLTGFEFTREEALRLSGQIVNLAGDLASFQNVQGGVAGAADRLRKGVLGETENLKSLGIVVNQTNPRFKALQNEFMTTRGLTEQQAKSLAILKMATEQSKNAVGDYSKTSKSLSNRLKALSERIIDLKESFGKFLIEGLNLPDLLDKVSNGLKKVINFFKGLSPNLKESISKFLLFIVTIGPLLAIFGTLGLTAAGVVSGMIAIAKTIALLVTPIGAAIAAIALLGAAFIKVFDVDMMKVGKTVLGFLVNFKTNFQIATTFVKQLVTNLWNNIGTITKTVWNNIVKNVFTAYEKMGAIAGAATGWFISNWDKAFIEILVLIGKFIVKATQKLLTFATTIGEVIIKAMQGQFKAASQLAGAAVLGFQRGIQKGLKEGLKSTTLKDAVTSALSQTGEFVGPLAGADLKKIIPLFPGFITGLGQAALAIENATDETKKPPPGAGDQLATGSVAGAARGSVEAFRIRAGVAKSQKQTADNTKAIEANTRELLDVGVPIKGLMQVDLATV